MIDQFSDDLGSLADPEHHTGPVDLRGFSTDVAITHLEKMYLIRWVEKTIANMVELGDVKCPCHFAIGQEAVAVGVADHLTHKDSCFGNHRSHGHYLAMGGAVEGLIAEVLGRGTGCSNGMGGSMHLYAGDKGFAGSVPIVGGTVPLALGAALAKKFQGETSIGVAFFGDGACEEGVISESLNFAAVMNLPVLFVVENNLFSSHMDIHLRQASNSVARLADAFGVRHSIVDGNDSIGVSAMASELIGHVRSGKGPAFLEAVTYRWLGHVGPDPNIDVGVRRSAHELSAWKRRDPIARLENAILAHSDVTREDLDKRYSEVAARIASARKAAYEAPFPHEESLLNYVYFNG